MCPIRGPKRAVSHSSKNVGAQVAIIQVIRRGVPTVLHTTSVEKRKNRRIDKFISISLGGHFRVKIKINCSIVSLMVYGQILQGEKTRCSCYVNLTVVFFAYIGHLLHSHNGILHIGQGVRRNTENVIPLMSKMCVIDTFYQ